MKSGLADLYPLADYYCGISDTPSPWRSLEVQRAQSPSARVWFVPESQFFLCLWLQMAGQRGRKGPGNAV